MLEVSNCANPNECGALCAAACADHHKGKKSFLAHIVGRNELLVMANEPGATCPGSACGLCAGVCPRQAITFQPASRVKKRATG